jgi:cell division protein FtsA
LTTFDYLTILKVYVKVSIEVVKDDKGEKMLKDIVSVLDFGSSKITILTGIKEVNNSFKLLASCDCEYEGFSNGEFVDTNNLKFQIQDAINQVEKELRCRIENLYVGVPAEFCFSYEKMITKSFDKKQKITSKIIDNLFLEDDEQNPYPTHTVINKSPLYYIINDDNRTNEPLNMIASKIQVKASYIMVENQFKLLVGGILESIGIKDYDFLSNTLSESIYLIEEYKRNEGALLVDCGFITTSVCQVLGDGLKELKSFSSGGGFITADLAKILDINYEEAEELKMQAIITLKPLGVDYYETSTGKKFGIKTVNEIILSRLDKIVELIKRCISSFEMELPNYIPICFTGGGLNFIEGISDYLRHEFDRPIELVKPKALLYARPDLSSSISLLNMAINIYK